MAGDTPTRGTSAICRPRRQHRKAQTRRMNSNSSVCFRMSERKALIAWLISLMTATIASRSSPAYFFRMWHVGLLRHVFTLLRAAKRRLPHGCFSRESMHLLTAWLGGQCTLRVHEAPKLRKCPMRGGTAQIQCPRRLSRCRVVALHDSDRTSAAVAGSFLAPGFVAFRIRCMRSCRPFCRRRRCGALSA
jgi:hypothetical protein